MAIPNVPIAAAPQATPAEGVVWFVDQNRYFGFHHPADWKVAELKEKVGLTLHAPPIVGEWQARVKLHVRICPRSQTLDQTLYLIRSETLRLTGFNFAGQSAGQHPCGKPGATLRWAMMQGFIELFVEQLFVVANPGVIVQITASAASPTYPRYRNAFGLILSSFRPQPALMARAQVWASPAGPLKAKATDAGSGETPVAAPRPDAPVAAAGPGVTAIPDVAGTAVAKIAPVPMPAPRPAVPTQVIPTAPQPAQPAEELAIDLSDEASLDGEELEELKVVADVSDKPDETALQLNATESNDAPVRVHRAEAPVPPKPPARVQPAPVTAARPPVVNATTAAPTPPPVDCTAAYTRVWVFLDLTAKSFVSEMRKASKRKGIKPGQKALFEGRAYLCDVLRRVIAAGPADAKERGGELNLFIQKKIAARSREVRDQFVERISAYSKAAAPAPAAGIGESQDLTGTTIDILGSYLAGSNDRESNVREEDQDQRQEFLEALAELDARVAGDFRQRLSTLFQRLPSTWAQLDATDIEAELGHG